MTGPACFPLYAGVGFPVAKVVVCVFSGTAERTGQLCVGVPAFLHGPLDPEWNANFRIGSQDAT